MGDGTSIMSIFIESNAGHTSFRLPNIAVWCRGLISLCRSSPKVFYTALPYLQVKPVADDEMFKVLRSGKRKNKAWKRMVTKVGFVLQLSFCPKPTWANSVLSPCVFNDV